MSGLFDGAMRYVNMAIVGGGLTWAITQGLGWTALAFGGWLLSLIGWELERRK